jgi:hypothetical protein
MVCGISSNVGFAVCLHWRRSVERFLRASGFLIITVVLDLIVSWLSGERLQIIAGLLNISVVIALVFYVVQHSIDYAELIFPALGRLLGVFCSQLVLARCTIHRLSFLLRNPEAAPNEKCICGSGRCGKSCHLGSKND